MLSQGLKVVPLSNKGKKEYNNYNVQRAKIFDAFKEPTLIKLIIECERITKD